MDDVATIRSDLVENFPDIDFTKFMIDLSERGYAVIPNILSSDEVNNIKKEMEDWIESIPNFETIHRSADPHGIFKFHEAGGQRHAWLSRINPRVQAPHKFIWGCEELVTSLDGSCYLDQRFHKKSKSWLHTDQAPNKKGLQCVQSLVALTNNEETSLVVYEKSHLYHEKYFENVEINDKEYNKDWQRIDEETIKLLESTKKVVKVPAGGMAFWDSRTFHCNQYGNKLNNGEYETRLVQYICYFPKNHPKNTKSQHNKRVKYYKERRTTSHWPAPIKVNPKQPRTYGNDDLKINYENLKIHDLTDIEEEILKIL